MIGATHTGQGRVLVLMGGGGHAAVVADAARLSGWNVIGFVSDAIPTEDDRRQQERAALTWLGPTHELAEVLASAPSAGVFAAVGDGALREKWMARAASLRAHVPAIVHPSAVVSNTASIAAGVLIGPHAVVNARARIGAGVIINTSAVIEHDVEIDMFAHIAPGSVLTGGVQVGKHVMIGARSVVVPERVIGDHALIAAGSVVTRNVEPGSRVAGCPAEPMKTPRTKRSDKHKT